MRRIGSIARLKPGCEGEYERYHQAVWPEVLRTLSEAGIRNYTIFRSGSNLFAYYEVDNLQKADAVFAAQPVCQRWQELMAPLMDAADGMAPWDAIDEIFHLD